MTLHRTLSISDLERQARCRLPANIYAYICGGADDGRTVYRNAQVFEQWGLAPRALRDVSSRSAEITLFGHRYSSPVGIAPTGLASLCWHRGDLALARAAQKENVPFILSGLSTIALEDIVAVAPDVWYQAYLPSDRSQIKRLLSRLQSAAVRQLVITIDVPVVSNREHELRNGFCLPLRIRPGLIARGVARPRWLVSTLLRTLWRDGIPRFENYAADRGGPILAALPGNRAQRDTLGWEDIRWIRDQWPGKLILKGILHPSDVFTANSLGVNGIILSNHGGRQLGDAISPMSLLAQVGTETKDMAIMIDSGFRRGTDVIKAMALGAAFVFVGRPTLYGLAAGGEVGVRRALEILRNEVTQNLGMLGCTSASDLSRDILCHTHPHTSFHEFNHA